VPSGLFASLRVATSMISRFLTTFFGAMVAPLQTLVVNRNLLVLLVKRDFAVRTSGTALGGLWLLLQPALQVVAFWFLFSVILGIRLDNQRAGFLGYFLVGMIPWLFLVEVLVRNLSVMKEFASVFRKSEFPLDLLPMLPSVISGLVLGSIYVVVVYVLYGPLSAMRAVVVVPLLAIWAAPLSYLFATVGVFLPDLAQALRFLLTIVFYVTPILFLPDMVPEQFHWMLAINPFADLLAVVHTWIEGAPFSFWNLGRPLLLWLALMSPVMVLFRRLTPHVREVV